MSAFYLPSTSSADVAQLQAAISAQKSRIAGLEAALPTIAGSLSWKSACRLRAAASIPRTASGTQEFRTLTGPGNGLLTVDGTAVEAGDRLLLDAVAVGAEAGIYVVTQPGSGVTPFILIRATDSNNNPANELVQGSATTIAAGATAAGRQYYQATANPIVLGVTTQSWVQFAGVPVALAGNVTGTTAASVVASVGGSLAAAINTATVAVTAATDANTGSAIVRRDAAGSFAGNTVTANTVTTNALTVNNNATITGTLQGYKFGVLGPYTGVQNFSNVNSQIVFILGTGCTFNLPTPVAALGVVWHVSLSSTATSASITTAAGLFYGPQFIGATSTQGFISGKSALSATQPGANISVMSDGTNWVVRGAAFGWN